MTRFGERERPVEGGVWRFTGDCGGFSRLSSRGGTDDDGLGSCMRGSPLTAVGDCAVLTVGLELIGDVGANGGCESKTARDILVRGDVSILSVGIGSVGDDGDNGGFTSNIARETVRGDLVPGDCSVLSASLE
jgi:hypothetical protein